MDEVEVIGVGMHPFGRFSDSSLKDLARVATVQALTDAGIGTRDIDVVYSSNAMGGMLQGQEMVRGQAVMREVGIERIPIVNVENACAGGSTALRQAILEIAAGAAEIVLAVGFEKMFVNDRTRTLDALQSAADVDVVRGAGLQFTAVYGMRLRKMLAEGTIRGEDLVEVSVKSHACGALNPYAQHQKEVTPEEVRAAPMIADPLTLLMTSSICDGAAAVVVARRGALKVDRPRVRFRSSRGASGFTPLPEGQPTLSEQNVTAAYEAAGLGPGDVDVAEVHDAMAPAELLAYEQLGFCEKGGAGALLAAGTTSITGAKPVNPSGGLSSRGHPVGATGLAQIAELTWQLRGEAGARQVGNEPRIALAHNSGGWLEGESAANNIHILERIDSWT
ncbi:MAG: thiolase family protein [Actinobacteria bacterium]|nr:thiolase family protein [Actinomycetota bacterium]